MARTSKKKTKLEIQYKELFKYTIKQGNAPMPESLEQPSPLRIVPSVSTGAAFDEPTKVD